jgi:hypothetical protein
MLADLLIEWLKTTKLANDRYLSNRPRDGI